MSNIAISELDYTANTLNDEDLLLISKKDGNTYTSMKMPGSVLNTGGTTCQFTDQKVINDVNSALSTYGVSKTSDIKTQCISAINDTSSAVNVKGVFIDPSKSDGFVGADKENLTDYTLLYDSSVFIWCRTSNPGTSQESRFSVWGSIQIKSNNDWYTCSHIISVSVGEATIGGYWDIQTWIVSQDRVNIKKGSVIKISFDSSSENNNYGYIICPLG